VTTTGNQNKIAKPFGRIGRQKQHLRSKNLLEERDAHNRSESGAQNAKRRGMNQHMG